INFDKLLEHGVIDPVDMQLIHFVETAEQAWTVIQNQYQLA
ncbi:MAG: hypothetical protein RL517_1219, partial [Pseudomonadota bacterium]